MSGSPGLGVRRVGRLALISALVAGCSGALPASGPSAPAPSAAASSPVALATTSAGSPKPASTHFTLARGEPWLLYGWYEGGDDSKVLYLVRHDGSDRQRILQDVAGDLRSPSWAPSGERIAFVVRDATYPDGAIWTADVDGDDAALFYDGRADGCESVFHPVWSPDGSRIALVCYHGRDADLAVLDVETMQLTTLARYPLPDFLDSPVSWSHDGETIAFTVLHWDPTDTFLDGSFIATVPASGDGDVTPLTERSSFAASPSWSPDDQELVYNSHDLGNGFPGPTSNLFRISPTGTGIEQLTDAPPGGEIRIAHPYWDPDANRIWVTYVRGMDFRPAWVDRATGEVTPLDVTGAGPIPRPLP